MCETVSKNETDKLFEAALSVCKERGCMSVSLLQRKLHIGYGRAADVIDQLEKTGYLGSSGSYDGNGCLRLYYPKPKTAAVID